GRVGTEVGGRLVPHRGRGPAGRGGPPVVPGPGRRRDRHVRVQRGAGRGRDRPARAARGGGGGGRGRAGPVAGRGGEGGDRAHGTVEVLDVDVGDDASVPCRGRAGAPVTDHVAGAVAEAGRVGAAAEPPPEHGAIELRGPGDVPRGDVQVRHAAGPRDRAFHAGVALAALIGHEGASSIWI